MSARPARVRFPDFDGEHYSAVKMRELVRVLERLVAQIHIDGPLIVGGGRVIRKVFSATVTWNPGSINNGAQEAVDVTVTGVELAKHNTVMVGFTKALQGMRLTGSVKADNTIEVVLRNDTGGALNLDSGSLTAAAVRWGD